MSDELKEKYQKDFSRVTPSPEFLGRLTAELEKEQALAKRKKFSAAKLIPAAAALVLILGAGGTYLSLSGGKHSPPDSPELSDISDINLNQSTTGGLKPFSYSADASDYADMLCGKINSGELECIKINSSNNFTSVPDADLKEADKITELLSASELAESCPDGEKTYYMLIFSDGSVEKLIVTDGKFIEVSGKNIFFQKK